jgi:hypothetical protein
LRRELNEWFQRRLQTEAAARPGGRRPGVLPAEEAGGPRINAIYLQQPPGLRVHFVNDAVRAGVAVQKFAFPGGEGWSELLNLATPVSH